MVLLSVIDFYVHADISLQGIYHETDVTEKCNRERYITKYRLRFVVRNVDVDFGVRIFRSCGYSPI